MAGTFYSRGVVKCIGVILILIPQLSHAASEASLKDSLKTVYTAAKNVRTVQAALDAFKGKIPAEILDDLKRRAAKHEKEELPSVEMRGDDTLVFSFKGQYVPLRILPGDREAFEINNHVVDFTDCKSMQERWTKMKAALPEFSKKTSALDLVLPSAHADDENGAERTNAITLGAGGAAIVGVASGFWWNVLGWSAMAYGAYLWNNAVCNDIGKDVITCGQLKDLLDEQMEKNPAAREAIEHKQPRSVCPKGEARLVEPEKTEKIQNYFKPMLLAHREGSRPIAICPGGAKGAFSRCLAESTLAAHYLCINLYGFSEAWLPAWVKVPSKPSTAAPPAPSAGESAHH